jgi:outer membrane lipoprotein-sorting protein
MAVAPAFGQATQPAGEERAKQMFDAMEQRLASAESLECSFELTAESREPGHPNQALRLEGSLLLDAGNRHRLEINERSTGHELFKLLVSDGSRGWWHDKDSPPYLVNNKPPATLNADFRTSLARAGLFLPTLPWPPVDAADAKDRFPVSRFRLGPVEKVGDREARRLEYDLFIKGQRGPHGEEMPFPVTLWVDQESSLPVKRVVRQDMMGVMVVTERYEKLTRDGPVDERAFELPKKTPDTLVEH